LRKINLWLGAVFIAGVFVVLAPDSANAQRGRSRLERPGTVAIGGGGGYGVMTGNSRYGLDFDNGGMYYITLKYMIGRRTALSAVFQNQSYGWKGPGLLDEEGVPIPTAVWESLVMNTFEGHFIYYLKRDTDTSTYMDIGAAVYRPELRGAGLDTGFPSLGGALIGALGTELFLRENWAIDLQARGVAFLGDGYTSTEKLLGDDEHVAGQIDDTGNVSVAGQISVGLLYYILK